MYPSSSSETEHRPRARSRRRPGVRLGCVLAGLVLGLGTAAQEGSRTDSDETLWSWRFRAQALLLETDRSAEAAAAFEHALALAPRAPDDWAGLALAQVQQGKLTAAGRSLERARALAAGRSSAWLAAQVALARAELSRGQTHPDEGAADRAHRLYTVALEQRPGDPRLLLELGDALVVAGRADAAIPWFERAAEAAPEWPEPTWRLSDLYRLAGRETEADAMRDEALARAALGTATPDDPGHWRTAPDPRQLAVGSAGFHVTFETRDIAEGFDAATARLARLDLDGDGGQDLLLTSARRSAVFTDGHRERPEAIEALAGFAIHGFALGDGNGDDLPDFCWLDLFGVPRLARNVDGRFEPLTIELPSGPFWGVFWVDVEGDGDADLALLGPRSVVLLNLGAQGFVEPASPIPWVEGRAQAGVWRDAGVHGENGSPVVDLAVVYAARRGVLYRGLGRGRFEARSLLRVPLALDAAIAHDIDHDGRTDLTVGNASMAVVFVDDPRGGLRRTGSAGGGGRPMLWADFTGRGVADLVAGGAVHTNLGLGRLAPPVRPTAWPEGMVLAVAGDFTGPAGQADGRLDLATVDTAGRLAVARNLGDQGGKGLPPTFLTVELRGAAVLGSVVEIMAGSAYQKRLVQGDGAPLTVGLGGRPNADVLRVTWADGRVEQRFDVAAGTAVVFER